MWIALTCVLVDAGCSSSHLPQAADTNTSWLRYCVRDKDCGGFGGCIEHVCSLQCNPSTEVSVCSRLAASATCEMPGSSEEGTCDVLCSSTDACTALGPNHSCRDGRCRVSAVLGAPSEKPQQPTQEPQREAQELGPDVGGVGSNRSAWLGDHWRIAYRTSLSFRPDDASGDWQNSPAEYRMHTMDIYPDGSSSATKTESENTPAPLSLGPVNIGRDGTVAEILAAARLSSVDPFDRPSSIWGVEPGEVRFHLPDGQPYRSLPFERTAMIIAVVPLQQSADWLVLGLRGETSAEVTLGRYSALQREWIKEPQVVSSDWRWEPRQGLWLGVRGDDAILVRLPGLMATLSGAAAAEPTSIEPVSAWRALDEPLDRFDPAWELMNKGARFIDFPQEANGPFYAPEVDEIEVAPDAHLIGVCHARFDASSDVAEQSGKLFFSVYDAEGTRLSGPELLGTADYRIGQCQVSWSGSAFLVSWAEEQTDVISTSPHWRILEAPDASTP